MIGRTHPLEGMLIDETRLSDGEREEMVKLGILSRDGTLQVHLPQPAAAGRTSLRKRAVHAPGALNEAYEYFPRPSSFSRGLHLRIHDVSVLLLSGTASVNELGKTAHVGDFRAQCWRTYRNLTALLEAEGMAWSDVVRTTCYLRDIERDYKDFNEVRTAFFRWLDLDPLPASTGVQARLCWDDLLVEIELTAVALADSGGKTP